jgi:transcriptional regulator with XRE-family HTH domain
VWQQKVRQILRTRKITQSFLASDMGVSEAHLANWLNSKRRISVDELQRLAACLDVTLYYLFDNGSYHNPRLNLLQESIIKLISQANDDEKKELDLIYQLTQRLLDKKKKPI